MRKTVLRPAITIAESEHRKLFTIATSAGGTMSAAAESLLMELERARVVPDGKLPEDFVRIGSHMTYRTEKDDLREATLVYPSDADITQGKISVLTPVGAAMIGLRTGQSITWESRDGRRNVLTVLSVVQTPEHAET
jgi:regulator of nucleoside diphosphate kinase